MSRIDIEDQCRHWVGRLRAGDTHVPDGEHVVPASTQEGVDAVGPAGLEPATTDYESVWSSALTRGNPTV